MKRSENFKVLKYKKFNRLWDQRKQIMISGGQTMKPVAFANLSGTQNERRI